jgi:hypothetical protein
MSAMYTLVGELPRHLYCFVDTKFVYKAVQKPRFVPCVWFGLVSYPGRLWGCTVMLECGAIYRNVPAHAMAFEDRPAMPWTPEDAQAWDCYGEGFTVLEYRYLAGLDCAAIANGRHVVGSYLFTAAPVGDGFSAYPEQAKEFCFIKTVDRRLTVQPTNHVVFRERSFTDSRLEFPKGLARQTETFSCE